MNFKNEFKFYLSSGIQATKKRFPLPPVRKNWQQDKEKKRNKSKTMISELPHHSFAHFTLKSLEGSVKQLQKWDTSCLSFFPPSMLEWPHQVPAPRNGDIFPFSESHSQLVWFQHWSWKAMKLHMSEQTGSLRQTPQSFESKSARFVGHF